MCSTILNKNMAPVMNNKVKKAGHITASTTNTALIEENINDKDLQVSRASFGLCVLDIGFTIWY